MNTYTITINCELLNETGILVARTLKTIVNTLPRVTDKYMFVASQHFKPIVVQLKKVIDLDTGLPVFICSGEEVDDTEGIKEVIGHAAFAMD
ncbi:DUF5952 family protein [Chitinophaga sp. GbtcB8]|jgi:hypothetical protein|uniref:DUF5952 family protein n=1 Tax=Chitinophaga sp. GbtcB8 TaxID=2824753 RepID=UPI001C3020CB|nr:DUF5952 family protein [Chitinophaga sp. GbtcB8]